MEKLATKWFKGISLISTTYVNLKNFHPNHRKAYHPYYKSTAAREPANKNITVHFSGKNNVLYLYYTRSKRMGGSCIYKRFQLNLLQIHAQQCNQSKTHSLGYFVQSVCSNNNNNHQKEKPCTKIKGLKFDSANILLNKIKQFLAVLHLSLRYTNRKNVGFETTVL